MQLVSKRPIANYTIPGKIVLSNLTQNQVDELKRELTFENPVYAQTKRYSRWHTTNIPPTLRYYIQPSANSLQVPLGVDLERLNAKVVKDYRVTKEVDYPPFVLELRKDQEEAANAYLEANQTHVLNGNIQMPTGKGKSILGAYLAYKLKQRTLIIVHKNDLVTGWQKDIKLAFDSKIKTGLIKAKSKVVGSHITIATVQTLNRLSDDELTTLYNTFGLVIHDEVHHCPASSFSISSNFDSRYKLGLTATPERADGLTHLIKLFFGGFCFTFDYEHGDEDILPVEVLVRDVPSIYYRPICEKTNWGKYLVTKVVKEPEYELKKGELLISEIPFKERPRIQYHEVDDYCVSNLIGNVIHDVLKEYDNGMSCVIFFSQKKHCVEYHDELTKFVHPDDLFLYYGDNPNNDLVLREVEKTRRTITLTTYSQATEGTNVTRWEVAFFVSSMNNGKNVEQASGRIRRVRADGDKLEVAKIYDYRTPNVYMLPSHGKTRDTRYNKLKFIVKGRKPQVFSKGYKR